MARRTQFISYNKNYLVLLISEIITVINTRTHAVHPFVINSRYNLARTFIGGIEIIEESASA